MRLIMALALAVALFMASGAMAAPQSPPDDEFELILKVVRKGNTLEDALLAYERGYDRFYLPVTELAKLIGFSADLDIDKGVVSGWFMQPDNTYVINTAENWYSIRGERVDMTPDDTVVKRYTSDYGEIYVRLDVLNQIWPVGFELDFSKLTLALGTFQKLPFELEQERKAKEEAWLARQNGGINTKGFAVVDKPYQTISKPLIDINSSLQWSSQDRQPEGLFNIRGRNDLLGFSADYTLQTQRRGGEFIWPDSMRTTLTRQTFGEETMPGGIRELQLGDVSSRTPDWVGGSNGGLGVRISSSPVKRSQSFDEVTIEGVSTPGWDVELYRGNELVEFGVVGETGEYRFDNVPLLTGNNVFRTVLYGPQGQTEERTEEYAIGGSLISPGDTQYEASFVDTRNNLIQFDQNDPFRQTTNDSDGLAYNAQVKRGINRHLSVFATGSKAQGREGGKSYVTAGADMAAGKVLGRVEAYKQLGAGSALDASLATSLKGWRVNLSTTLLRNFESEDAGFGDSAKVFDATGRLARTFATGFGAASLNLTAQRQKDESDRTNTQYSASTALGRGGMRVGNVVNANYSNSGLNQITGRTNLTYRLSSKTSLRSLLTYNIYPEKEFSDFSADLNYRPNRDLIIGLQAGQNLQSRNSRLGGTMSYDFGTVLAGLNANWQQDGGINVGLRASTSLQPFGENGDYILNSRGSRDESAILGRVFQDVNLNNVYDYQDELLPDTMVELEGRDLEKTNAQGEFSTIQSERGAYKAVSIDRDQTPNPFLVPQEKGYLVFLRTGVRQDLDIPMVESGVVDGRAFFENGHPVPGLKLQLIDYTGKPAKETMTAFDGYYSFEFVKPGRYVVRADPSANLMVPPRVIGVSPDALFAYGVDVELQDKPSSDIKVSAAKVSHNKGEILGLLQSLQKTLKRATADQAL